MSDKNNELKYNLLIIDDFPIDGLDGYGDKRGDLYSYLRKALELRVGEIKNLYCICGGESSKAEVPKFNFEWHNWTPTDVSFDTYNYYQFDFGNIKSENHDGKDIEEVAEAIADSIKGILGIILDKLDKDSYTIVLIDKSLCPKDESNTDSVRTGELASQKLVEKLKGKQGVTIVLRYTAQYNAEDAIPITWTAVSDFAYAIKKRLSLSQG